MVSMLFQLVLSLSLIVIGTLFYRLTGGKRPNVAAAPSKVIYRIRNIPARYSTREQSRKVIEAILSTPDKPCIIKVRSFATNIDHNLTRTITTRTVTFHLNDTPPLQLKSNAQNEWTFTGFDNESQQTDDYLIIDTHFVGFTVLSSPKDVDHDFDLVAISGLGSHAWGSFKKRGETSMWLVDKLPRNWSRARIMIYGYRSPIVGTKDRQTLQDIAKTLKNNLVKMRKSQSTLKLSARRVPLVFLAHSLGGLVVKQAIVNLSMQSLTEPETQETFQLVYAMLFFGVPCKGLDGERLGLAAMAKGQSREGFLSDLRYNSPMVDKLAQEFLEVFESRPWVKIYSFHETVESATAVIGYWGIPSITGPTEYWVGKDAAFNGREIERKKDEIYSIPIHTDHSSLVKCNEEETFTTISNVLEGIDWNTAIEFYKRQGGQGANLPNAFQPLTREELECMTSLGPSTYVQDKEFNPERIEGTCEWFLHHQHFTAWYERNASGLLWVSGDPGCGKSVLSKYLVDKKLQKTDVQSTCFYFFKDLPGRNNATTALKAILHQLFDQQPALLKYAMNDFERSKIGFIQTFDTYWAILLEATKSAEAHSVVFILDALDECQESGLNIIKKLNNLYKDKAESSTSNSVVKFLVTSRPYHNIEREFVELTRSMPTIRLAGEEDPDAINREINLVIDFRVDNMPWEETTKSQLREALRKPLNRTYLWVVLVFDVLELTLKVTQKNAALIVNNMPQDLWAAYEAILNKGSNKRPLVRRLLYIVLCAERPLTLAEMNIALNIINDCRTLSDVDRQETNELLKVEIRNLCGLFLSVVDSKIYLIHQTAKDFLISKHEDTLGYSLRCEPPLDLNWKSTFLLEDGNKILAEACISYLLFSEFECALQSAEGEYVFLDYSSKFWAVHFREAKVGDYKSRIAESALALCDMSSKRCQLWYKIWATSSRSQPVLPGSLTLAAYFGHISTVEQLLLEKGTELETKSNSGRTPLSWAAENGYEAVVKLLLEKGAELETKDTVYGRTPLLWAIRNGHEVVVKLLLEKGAELETKDTGYGRTPLSWAADNGREAVVKLLLEKGAKLETKSKYGQTPLSWAARNGHEAVVKLLLEKGAKLETKSRNGRTPLSWAADNGREAVVKLLLEKGAELETKDTDYGQTPLSWAARNGHEVVVKLLLEKGAELETKDTVYGRTPLSWAIRNGHKGVVKLLLEKGAKLETKSKYGQTLLSWVARNRHEAVVKLLLEKGAKLETKSKNGRTPLSWAVRNGHEVVVKLLLEKGAEMETKDTDNGQTPLSWAARNGYKGVVKLLLEKGAELETKDTDDSRTPLSWAAENGHEGVVKLLLEKGAELETKDTVYGRTPLSWATRNGHKGVVKLLLEKGAKEL